VPSFGFYSRHGRRSMSERGDKLRVTWVTPDRLDEFVP
jgi:hypothetical protein